MISDYEFIIIFIINYHLLDDPFVTLNVFIAKDLAQ